MTDHSKTEGAGYSYDDFTGTPKTTEGGHFLWWCAGAHQPLLRRFPSEQTKYAGLGGVLLATFLLAALSSGYAIYSIFGSLLWTVIVALLWGAIIFNFDRFLVSTMRKYGISRRKQFWMALPRLGLAILIGITIARPLELKIFEKEINVKMEENAHYKMQRNDSLLQVENRQVLQTAEAERARLTGRRRSIEDTLSRLQSDYVREADGTGGSGQRGVRQLTQLKMGAYETARQQYAPELVQIDAALRTQDSLLTAARNGEQARRGLYATQVAANRGFLERNKALSDLSEDEPSVWWTSVLLSLLIILIEVGPILSKIIMPVGPYDIALAREELVQMAADESELRRDRELLFEKKKQFFQRQKNVSEELVNKLAELQKKHIDEELDKWERGEWSARDHRPSMDEVLRKIRERYGMNEDHVL